ncbi:MAG: hypothetical protein AAF376_14580 [Pseudomonadota bacterium]
MSVHPNPHIAIDRLAKLQRQIADLRRQETLAQAAILTLADGLHDGVARSARIDTGRDGIRRIRVLPAPPVATDGADPLDIRQPDAGMAERGDTQAG